MKKIFSIIALVALTFAGCSKVDVDTITTAPMEGIRTVSITLVGADDAITRSTLSNDSTLVWSTGDCVAYFVDATGTRQVADINNDGTFNITLDADAHVVNVVYSVSTDSQYDNVTYANYPKTIPTAQTQPTVGVFEGKNLPLTGSVSVAAGEVPTSVKATYAVNGGAIMSFVIKCNNETYKAETLNSLVLTADDKPTYTVALPSDKTVADVVGEKLYCVIEEGTYTNLLVTLNTTTAKYICQTDLTSKSGATIATGDHDIFSLKIDKSATVQRISAGLNIKVGNGQWASWDGTTTMAQTAGLAAGAIMGTDATPVVVNIVTGGGTTMTKEQMQALTAAIRALNSASRIRLDMSDVKAVATGGVNEETFYRAFPSESNVYTYPLREFVFPTDHSNITSLSQTFAKCPNLISVSTIPSAVTDMGSTFYGCTSFNHPIEIPSGVKNMYFTFFNCSSFNQPIEIPSGVTNIEYLFGECKALNQPIAISSGVTNMRYAFNGCKALNQPIAIPSGVTNIYATFKNCTSFNQSVIIPSGVTDISHTFFNCTQLSGKTITIKSTTPLTYASAFYELSTNKLDLVLSAELYDAISADDLTENKWAGTTWKSITKSLELKLGGNWDGTTTSAQKVLAAGATLGSAAFVCPVTISTVTDRSMTYAEMQALAEAIRALNSASRIRLDMSDVKAATVANSYDELLFNAFYKVGASTPALKEFIFPTDRSNISNLSNTFQNCPNLTSVSPLPSGVKNLYRTFSGCTSFNQQVTIPSGVTNMESAFNGCTVLNQPIVMPSGVTALARVFRDCLAFNQPITIPLGANDMESAFNRCTSFNQSVTIPSGVAIMNNLFNGCTALSGKTITIKCTNLQYKADAFTNVPTGSLDLVLSPALYAGASGSTWNGYTWKSITQAQ